MADPKNPTLEERLAALEKQHAETLAENAKLKSLSIASIVAVPDGTHDLDTFTEGEFKHKGSGKTFRLKLVPDDEQGRKFHLKSKEASFFASSTAELGEHFHGDFSKWEEKPATKK